MGLNFNTAARKIMETQSHKLTYVYTYGKLIYATGLTQLQDHPPLTEPTSSGGSNRTSRGGEHAQPITADAVRAELHL